MCCDQENSSRGSTNPPSLERSCCCKCMKTICRGVERMCCNYCDKESHKGCTGVTRDAYQRPKPPQKQRLNLWEMLFFYSSRSYSHWSVYRWNWTKENRAQEKFDRTTGECRWNQHQDGWIKRTCFWIGPRKSRLHILAYLIREFEDVLKFHAPFLNTFNTTI